ncbi:hypothetical protein FDJ06_gp010 [Pseudomonas phage SL2]|uniref:Glycine zipper domain-containing protein n=2 Tax=Viruses TaxID=10239 RepID=A0A2D1GQF8_9CAUD|nr:hypothetical protein FDJ06_gp010 [Pseudomonas phage SL2]ATN94587.1 hypothetical protein SL2_010 [Pseudomonas phage SL2]
MNKLILVLSLVLASMILEASEIKTTTNGIIKQVDCQLVAKDNSIAGATIGGTVGAAAGAAVGKALLGKSGSWIGGLIGGAAGGAIGNNMAATETYQCKMIIEDHGKLYMNQIVTNKKLEPDMSVTIVEMSDGTYEIM